jgi:hypothetical protein
MPIFIGIDIDLMTICMTIGIYVVHKWTTSPTVITMF